MHRLSWSAGPLICWSAGLLVHLFVGQVVRWCVGSLVWWSVGIRVVEPIANIELDAQVCAFVFARGILGLRFFGKLVRARSSYFLARCRNLAR